MFQTVHLECHQQRFPRPHWGSLQRSPDPLAGLRGPTSKGRGGEGRRGEERGGKGGDGLWTLTMLETDWPLQLVLTVSDRVTSRSEIVSMFSVVWK